jgi:hypothetical protein
LPGQRLHVFEGHEDHRIPPEVRAVLLAAGRDREPLEELRARFRGAFDVVPKRGEIERLSEAPRPMNDSTRVEASMISAIKSVLSTYASPL